MSDELEEAYNAILNQRVPVKWRVSAKTLCQFLNLPEIKAIR